jgi:hypothetical protein
MTAKLNKKILFYVPPAYITMSKGRRQTQSESVKANHKVQVFIGV